MTTSRRPDKLEIIGRAFSVLKTVNDVAFIWQAVGLPLCSLANQRCNLSSDEVQRLRVAFAYLQLRWPRQADAARQLRLIDFNRLGGELEISDYVSAFKSSTGQCHGAAIIARHSVQSLDDDLTSRDFDWFVKEMSKPDMSKEHWAFCLNHPRTPNKGAKRQFQAMCNWWRLFECNAIYYVSSNPRSFTSWIPFRSFKSDPDEFFHLLDCAESFALEQIQRVGQCSKCGKSRWLYGTGLEFRQDLRVGLISDTIQWCDRCNWKKEFVTPLALQIALKVVPRPKKRIRWCPPFGQTLSGLERILLDHVCQYLLGESANCQLPSDIALTKQKKLENKQSLRACEILLGPTELGFQLLGLQLRHNNFPLEYFFLRSIVPLRISLNPAYRPNKLWLLRLSRQGGSLERGRPWKLVMNFLIADFCDVVPGACVLTV